MDDPGPALHDHRSDADAAHREGRLLARPHAPAIAEGQHAAARVVPLRLAAGGDALLRVPAGHRADVPSALVVMLHGAGGDARGALSLVADREVERALVLAPRSQGRSWDVIVDELGPDVALLDRALEAVFAKFAVDPGRVALAGFSDGASYALTVALANGSLFRRVVAFSPGFAVPLPRDGRPRVWVSHGTGDRVLPIERCSRVLVPRLRAAGLDVRYREFDGGHSMPDAIVAEAWAWLSEP